MAGYYQLNLLFPIESSCLVFLEMDCENEICALPGAEIAVATTVAMEVAAIKMVAIGRKVVVENQRGP